MKIKRILRFYYFAESLDKTIDKLILKYACGSGVADGFTSAEKICSLIGEKNELNTLWKYLDGVISTLTEKDKQTLKEYACMRSGLSVQDGETRKEVKRASVKFIRHARRLEKFAEGIKLAGKYYCLLLSG